MAEFALNGRSTGVPKVASPLVFAAVGVIIRPDDTDVLARLYEFAGISADNMFGLDEELWDEAFNPTYRFLDLLPVGVFADGFDRSGNCHVVYIRYTYQDMNPTYAYAQPNAVAGAVSFPVIDTETNAYKQLLQFCNDYGITSVPSVVLGNNIR